MSTSEENGARATVALVNSKVETVKESVKTVDTKIDGLDTFIRAEFEHLRGLPTAVASLTERVLHAETRITQLERADDQRQGWRRVTLPQILIGVVGLAIAVTNIVVMLSAS